MKKAVKTAPKFSTILSDFPKREVGRLTPGLGDHPTESGEEGTVHTGKTGYAEIIGKMEVVASSWFFAFVTGHLQGHSLAALMAIFFCVIEGLASFFYIS